MRSDGETYGPFVYQRENAVQVFLTWLQSNEEIDERRACPKVDRNDKRGLGQVQRRNRMPHLQQNLEKADFKDVFDVYDPNTGEYCGQSHRRCYFNAIRDLRVQ